MKKQKREREREREREIWSLSRLEKGRRRELYLCHEAPLDIVGWFALRNQIPLSHSVNPFSFLFTFSLPSIYPSLYFHFHFFHHNILKSSIHHSLPYYYCINTNLLSTSQLHFYPYHFLSTYFYND